MDQQKTSLTLFTGWPLLCEQAAKDKSVFENFRSSPSAKSVVETVTFKAGRQCLQQIVSQNPEFTRYFDKFRTSEDVGNPETYGYRYKWFSEKIFFSPTTLRYIRVLSDLKKFFGSLDGMRIVEIGVGYGGQCKIISDLYEFESYTLVDLPSCLPLAKKYLDHFEVRNIICSTLDELDKKNQYDLVISNYAFSEITKGLQDDYIDKVTRKSLRGYLLCNLPSHGTKINSYSKEELTNLLNEANVAVFEKKPYLPKFETQYNVSLLVWGTN
jgi:putative sugar O-methyltransferase